MGDTKGTKIGEVRPTAGGEWRLARTSTRTKEHTIDHGAAAAAAAETLSDEHRRVQLAR